METFEAKPFYEVPLSSQISALGGEGYNCNVKVEHIKGTFKHRYIFNTDKGTACLVSQNDFQCGIIDDAVTHLVYFDLDKIEYTLLTPIKAKDKTFAKKVLGNTFEEMMVSLKGLWPNRIVWNLSEPEPFIN